MALPSSRDITLNPADPPPSTLLNKLQDCIVGRKRPTSRRWISMASHPTDVSHVPNGSISSFANGVQMLAASTTLDNIRAGDYEEGDRITAFGVRFLGTGGAITMKFDLGVTNGSGAETINTLSVANPPASWATYTLTLATPITIAAGMAARFRTVQQGAFVSATIGGWFTDTDRL